MHLPDRLLAAPEQRLNRGARGVEDIMDDVQGAGYGGYEEIAQEARS
jgi:hypothetical protein